MRSLLFFSGLFLLSSVWMPGQTLPPLARAKLLACDGLPCIDAEAGGKHLRLGVDTGNPNSALNLKSAQALGLTLEPVNGADGKPVPGYQMAVLNDVRVGDIVFKRLRFLAIDLSPAIQSKTFPDIDGTLGYGALKDRIAQLDYPAGAFSVSEPLVAAARCPGDCGEMALITFGQHGPPIVTTKGFAVNGKPVSVQVDTMFTGTLLVFPASVEKLGLTREAESKTSEHFAFTDEGVDMVRSSARELRFGAKALAADTPLYFAGPKVHLPDGLFDGTVGIALLASHKVTFDFRDNLFWLD